MCRCAACGCHHFALGPARGARPFPVGCAPPDPSFPSTSHASRNAPPPIMHAPPHAHSPLCPCVPLELPAPCRAPPGIPPGLPLPCPRPPSAMCLSGQRQTPGLGGAGPAWQTANGTLPIKTGHGNPCAWSVRLLNSQLCKCQARGPHCRFAVRHGVHGDGAHMHAHMPQADQAQSPWRIKPSAIAENFTTQRHSQR